MVKSLAGILAVSIAALLFAACGGSGLSPAQQERCDELQRSITRMQEVLPDLKFEYQIKSAEEITKWKKERADRGC